MRHPTHHQWLDDPEARFLLSEGLDLSMGRPVPIRHSHVGYVDARIRYFVRKRQLSVDRRPKATAPSRYLQGKLGWHV